MKHRKQKYLLVKRSELLGLVFAGFVLFITNIVAVILLINSL